MPCEMLMITRVVTLSIKNKILLKMSNLMYQRDITFRPPWYFIVLGKFCSTTLFDKFFKNNFHHKPNTSPSSKINLQSTSVTFTRIFFELFVQAIRRSLSLENHFPFNFMREQRCREQVVVLPYSNNIGTRLSFIKY